MRLAVPESLHADVVAGWKNKLHAAAAHVPPAGMLAERHRKTAEPGTEERRDLPASLGIGL